MIEIKTRAARVIVLAAAFVGAGILPLIGVVAEAFAQPVDGWSRQAVHAVVARAKSDPGVLWELKDAPLDLAIEDLKNLWLFGEQSVEERDLARRRGRESEWLALETKASRNPDDAARIFPVARDVLLNHPELEEYISRKLDRMRGVLLEARTTGEPTDESRHALIEHIYLLNLARRIPGDAAFRLVGPFVFAPYHPPQDHGDVWVTSPAEHAQNTLATLVKERLGEKIPNDIEGTRQWWKNNEYRFVRPSDVAMEKSGVAASNVSRTPGDATIPIIVRPMLEAQRKWLFIGLGVVVILIVAALGARRARRKF